MNGDRNDEPVSGDEAALEARRQALEAELQVHRPEVAAVAEAPPAERGGWAKGARLASDFVAGVLVGGAIGWFLDRLFGTSPWGLIICLLFGFAAGTLTALRSAGLVRQAEGLPRDRG